MFGFGLKPLTDEAAVVVAIRAAVLCRAAEDRGATISTEMVATMVSRALKEFSLKPSPDDNVKKARMMTTCLACGESGFIESLIERLKRTAGTFELQPEDVARAREVYRQDVEEFNREHRRARG
jgi:hypothetical protein